MSQPSSFSVPTSGPASPDAVTGAMNDSLSALLSQNKGASAPSYKVAGTLWMDDSASPWTLKLYDGATWIIVATVNPSTHAVQWPIAALPVVGTVSQTSGAPTGAIVERGSTSDGYYVRFADGTQRCWGKVSITPVANTPTSASVTFPKPFSSGASTLAQATAITSSPGTQVLGVSYNSLSTTGMTVLLTRSNTTDTDVAWSADGRWF